MSQAHLSPRENLKVLIVEDDRTYRVLAAESLQCIEDYSVKRLIADTAKTGLQTFRKERPNITFLDIELPDGSGIDLLKACLKCDPNAFVVMMTSSASANDVNSANQAGAKGYILKPFNMKKIQDVMAVYANSNMLVNSPKKRHDTSDLKIDMESLFETEDNKEKDNKNSELAVIEEWDILFVDDYLTNCDNAKRNLSKFKCQIDTACSGEEALEKIKNKHFQMMFLNTNLPDIDGYRLTMQVRSKDRNDPIKAYVIGMMAHMDEVKEKRWLQVGMNDYLIKPCTFTAMEKMLKKYAKQYKDDLNETFYS